MKKIQRRYGHIKDRPGSRRNFYRVAQPLALPAAFTLAGSPDLREHYDQGQHGSCVWNALLLCFEFSHHKTFGAFAELSRMFGYRQTMCMEGTDPTTDGGCMPADALRFQMQTGSCAEDLWPYTADASGLENTPPQACFDSARTNQALQEQSLPQDILTIKQAIFAGQPVLFGIQCFSGAYGIESDFAAKNGMVGLPSSYDQLNGNLGGHGIAAIGWDDHLQIPKPAKGIKWPWVKQEYTVGALWIRNSWGDQWGKGGDFAIPYDFVGDPNLADSFWTISKVE